MVFKSIIGAICACLTLASFNAIALPITVYDNIAGTALVSPTSTVSGQFDINPAIPSTGNYNTPYDVTSATATFNFTDDFDPLRYNGSSTYSYYFNNSVSNNADTKFYYYRNKINYYINDADNVSVSITNQMSTDGTTYYDSTNYYTGLNFDGSYQTGRYCDGFGFLGACTDWDYNYRYNYTRNYTDEAGWKGDLTMTLVYGTEALAELSDDGISTFTLASACSTCDILYLDGMLTANIEESVNVPEPPMILLLTSGLIGLMGFARRRKI